MAFTNVLLIFGILKVISMLMPQSAFRIAFTNGLMSESMIIWFLFVYLEIGRKYGSNQVELTVADAENIPFESDFFDAVITTDTCYFWKEPRKVYMEINRVLKTKGIFVNSMNTMYARSVNKMRKEECASDMEKLIRLSKDTSLEVLFKQKLSRNEEQVVFIKH